MNINWLFQNFIELKISIPDQEIQDWVRSCLKQAEESDEPYGYFFHTGTGNFMVILMGYEDEYDIIVAKNYYELSINKE
jgi:hypothetical protein